MVKRSIGSRGSRAEDSQTKRPRVESRSQTRSPEGGRRWACPFYVRSPEQFRSSKACAGLGFPDISRLKEHLYRCHSQKASCPRCRSSFGDTTEMIAHMRYPESCKLEVDDTQDAVKKGIGVAAMESLRSRKRTVHQRHEDRWYEIWRIVFPGHSPPSSPCEYLRPLQLLCYHATGVVTDGIRYDEPRLSETGFRGSR